MRSNDCLIKKGGDGIEAILREVEKVASYNALTAKQTLRLRLLAEELGGMLSELLKNFKGVFFIENDGNNYELHVEVSASVLDPLTKAALIDVSSSKKNASSVGFMGKLKEIAENMLIYADSPDGVPPSPSWYPQFDNGMNYHYSYVWTLNSYIDECKSENKAEEWDRLEQSIVAKLADDVIVGIKGRNIEIIIKKQF